MEPWIQTLLEPLHYDYLWRAIWVSALIGTVCGFLSAFVTLKGWSLMGDALSHAVVPGVSIAWLLGLPFTIGAFLAGLLAAGAMAFIRTRTIIREDATIGIVFTSFFAAGLLLISLFPSQLNLQTILLGNVLGIADSDLAQLVWICVCTLLVLVFKWRDLMLLCFDVNLARSLGLRANALHVTLLALLAATAVAALQAVGACLVVAMLVIPGATAYLLTDRFGRMALISMALGLVCSLCGGYASYWFNGSTGGCIVTLQALVFVGVFLFAPRRGYLANRRRIAAHPPAPCPP